MTSIRAKGSPTKRGVAGTEERVERLLKFSEFASSVSMSEDEMRDSVGKEAWDSYWARLDAIKGQMADAQREAEKIRLRLEAAFDGRN